LGNLVKAIKVDDYRLLARRRLPKAVFDFLEGGAEDERGLAHNRAVFDQVRFRPRRFVDVSKRILETNLFGRRIAAPLAIAPTGLNGLIWPQGDLALAQAAADAGIPFVLSTASSMSIEEIARGRDGARWFQLYVFQREIADQLVQRALAADYSALVLTTDVSINGFRERDMRNGFGLPFRYSPGLVIDGALHLRWSMDFLRNGAPQLANLSSPEAMSPAAQAALVSRQMDACFGWDDLKRLRDRWPRTLIVKGLLDPEDAARCFALGVDGVILSNHGARQLDGAPSPLDVLQDTVARVGPGCVMADSGFRRGSEVVKALALGARLVLLGRAVLYGLAARGRFGVDDVLRMIKTEIDCTLAQIGCSSVADLAPAYIAEAAPLARGSSPPSPA
jgi:(S)-mandelate dehydrogenase